MIFVRGNANFWYKLLSSYKNQLFELINTKILHLSSNRKKKKIKINLSKNHQDFMSIKLHTSSIIVKNQFIYKKKLEIEQKELIKKKEINIYHKLSFASVDLLCNLLSFKEASSCNYQFQQRPMSYTILCTRGDIQKTRIIRVVPY